jgi:hypothetical protein
LELLKFIQNNENWKEIIQEKPYCITVKESVDYILLIYSQIESDFSNPIVRECRGVILRKFDLRVVCFPFTKFFNVQEQLSSFINWSTARVTEKLDGSIIKLWFDYGNWHISTNGTINAADAELQMAMGEVRNYHDLFMSADNVSYALFDRLDINKTFMFELVSPLNRVVVPYKRTEVYHIGTRDNNTFEESNDDIGIQKPKEYDLYSVTSCLLAVQELPFSEEGYVVVDGHFNRVKIKSPAYVAAHHLKNNGVITMSRIVDMIKINGQDDFLSIYPEYQESFDLVLNGIYKFLNIITAEWGSVSEIEFADRKELAMTANKSKCPSVIYSLWDGKSSSVREWLFNQQNDKLLKWIGVE